MQQFWPGKTKGILNGLSSGNKAGSVLPTKVISFSQSEITNMNHHYYLANLCSLIKPVYPVF